MKTKQQLPFDKATLRTFVDVRDRQVQRVRIAFQNRVRAIEQGADETANVGQMEMLDAWFEEFEKLERRLERDIARTASAHPMFERLVAIRGIGPNLAAKLLTFIDIYRCNNVSALWRYAGWGVTNGQRDRRVAGVKPVYNGRLKTHCYLIGASFLKSKSPYASLYYRRMDTNMRTRMDPNSGQRNISTTAIRVDDRIPQDQRDAIIAQVRSIMPMTAFNRLPIEARLALLDTGMADLLAQLGYQTKDEPLADDGEDEEVNETGGYWSKLHCHNDAMRWMIKIFLQHLWIVWRELEGLPTNAPWVLENMPGHTTYIPPQDFGWL